MVAVAHTVTGTNVAKRVSWGAVFAGVVAAVAVHALLGILGIAIGASVIDPLQEAHPLEGIGVGAGIYFLVISIIALFAGGYVAGALAVVQDRLDRTLHGLVTWAVSTLLLLWLVGTGVGSVVGGTLNLLGKGASMMGSAASAMVSTRGGQSTANGQSGMTVDIEAIRQEARSILRSTGEPALQPGELADTAAQVRQSASAAAQRIVRDPQAADEEIQRLLDRIQAEAQPAINAADRDALANVLTRRTDMTREEALATVSRWEAAYGNAYARAKAQWQDLKANADQTVRELGDKTSDIAAAAAWWSFFMLLLGAIAAALGANVGGNRLVAAVREQSLR